MNEYLGKNAQSFLKKAYQHANSSIMRFNFRS